MKNRTIPLMYRFFLLFFGIMLLGVSIITLSNFFILGWRIKYILEFNIFPVLFEGFTGTLFLQGIALTGLKNTQKLSQGLLKQGDYAKAWNEMMSFPPRIFWGMAGFGLAASFFQHISEKLYYGYALNRMYFLSLAGDLLFEQTLSLILAILFFTGARRLLRPYVLQIPGGLINRFRGTTFYNNLLVIFCCLFVITIYSILWYVFGTFAKQKSPRIDFLIYLSLFDIGFGIVIFSMFIREIRSDFQVLIEAMASLLKGSRGQLKTKLPIVSDNELGNLGLIFNQLQEKVSKEYDEIDAELQLARNVQQRLLPDGEKCFGAYTVAGVCMPCHDVGGDFFDIIPLDGTKFTVIIGDVIGKGMPAALMMSAALLLFRNEIRRGGAAAKILNRLNQLVLESKMDGICLTMGIAVFDTRRNVMQYASAGHVAPYILQGSGVHQVPCSSLPLGIDPAETYVQIEYAVRENDGFAFYTDGMIDGFSDRRSSGFDVLEQILASLPEQPTLTRQIDCIIKSIEARGKPEHGDDKTLVIVRYDACGQPAQPVV